MLIANGSSDNIDGPCLGFMHSPISENNLNIVFTNMFLGPFLEVEIIFQVVTFCL